MTTRTRQRAAPVPVAGPEVAPSNVIELRPGFALSPVVEALPKPSSRARRKVTRGPNLITKVTTETAEKHSKNKNLIGGTGLTQVSASQSVSPSPGVPSTNDPTFQRLVATLPAMKLREAFPLEATSHQNMMGRAREGGYTVDPAFHDFRAFLAHVGPRPSEAWTLDRLEPRNPLYGPGLVRWADKRQQANNRADTVLLMMDGVTRPLAEWARLTGQQRRTLAKRIDRGWSHAEAIRGRRLEGEPTPDVTPLAVTPPVRSATEWPDGLPKQGDWEDGFLGFCRTWPEYARAGFTRAVLLRWVVTNAARHASDDLQRHFPAYDETAYMPEPDGYAEHPSNILIGRCERRNCEALRLMNGDRKQQDLVYNLVRRWPNVQSPQAAKSIKRPMDDE